MTFIEEYKIKPSLCDEIINYHKNNTEYKVVGTIDGGRIDPKVKDSMDVIFYNDSSHPTILAFFAASAFSAIVDLFIFLIDFLTITSVFLDPGIEPFTKSNWFSISFLIISRVDFPIEPVDPSIAIFFSLKH